MQSEIFAISVKRLKHTIVFYYFRCLKPHWIYPTTHTSVHSPTRSQSFNKFHRLQQLFKKQSKILKYRGTRHGLGAGSETGAGFQHSVRQLLVLSTAMVTVINGCVFAFYLNGTARFEEIVTKMNKVPSGTTK